MMVLILKSLLGATIGAVLVLTLRILVDSIQQIRRGEVTGALQAFGMIFAPAVMFICVAGLLAVLIFAR
jgi:hypothetical protein